VFVVIMMKMRKII